jgi:neopullulanase
MNYPVARACLGFFVGDRLARGQVAQSGYQQIDTLDADEFAREIDRVLTLYPRPVTEVQFNLLGSHDTPRFKTLARRDDSAYRLATLFQMTYPGAPCIYYGDEIGLEGKHDPDCRGGFPWDQGRWDVEMRNFVQRCIALRTAHGALRRGDFAWLLSDGGVVAYVRHLGSETVLIVLNSNRRAVTLDVPVADHLGEGARVRDVWADRATRVVGGVLPALTIPSRSGVVFVAEVESAP